VGRSRSRQTHKSHRGVLAFGIILVICGVILIFSALDLSNIQPLDLTYRGPAGELTIDSFTEAEEQRIFAGFIIGGIGIVLIKIGK